MLLFVSLPYVRTRCCEWYEQTVNHIRLISVQLTLLGDAAVTNDIGTLSNAYEVLYAAAYIVGEFSEYVIA